VSVQAELIANLGRVMQLAFVPKDFDVALKYWTEVMGAGPFFLNRHIRLPDMKFRGKPSDIDFSMGLGYWGDMQIELIKQHNAAPSIFNEWRDAGLEGLQHVCVQVSDMNHARGVCSRSGAVVLQEATFPNGGVIYVDTGGGPGTIVELLQMPHGTGAYFDYMREQARNWDGSRPIREQEEVLQAVVL
jgi:methylmalonyl-CoA/ethylmalonyl-CoA epimerase